MNVKEALDEFKKVEVELINIGDANQALMTNSDNLYAKLARFSQLYNFLIHKTNFLSDEYLLVLDILDDLVLENPSMEDLVNKVIALGKNNVQEQDASKKEEDVQSTTLSEDISIPIESIVSEVKSMKSWNPDYIEELELELKFHQKRLISNQGLFDSSTYQRLTDDINSTFDKINSFKMMLNSDAMDSLMKM